MSFLTIFIGILLIFCIIYSTILFGIKNKGGLILNKLQKLIDALPKSFLIYESIIGLLFGTLLIIVTFSQNATIGTKLIISAYSIVSILLYPFSRATIFRPGKSFEIIRKSMEKSDLKSFFLMLMFVYGSWGFSVAFSFVLAFFFGSLQIIRILLAENAKVIWYDEFTLFSNVKALKDYTVNRVKESI